MLVQQGPSATQGAHPQLLSLELNVVHARRATALGLLHPPDRLLVRCFGTTAAARRVAGVRPLPLHARDEERLRASGAAAAGDQAPLEAPGVQKVAPDATRENRGVLLHRLRPPLSSCCNLRAELQCQLASTSEGTIVLAELLPITVHDRGATGWQAGPHQVLRAVSKSFLLLLRRRWRLRSNIRHWSFAGETANQNRSRDIPGLVGN
mmetsp:Transcript_136540/g.353979  ORF Transcript_136540/g.353979 Transcript_136540/m.353979 type:complete len:208 (-) Transcript_136540:938-1561(-)